MINKGYIIEECSIYNKPFINDNRVLIFRELWEMVEWDDPCCLTHLSSSYLNYGDTNNYPDGPLYITDLNFFENIEVCKKLAIFIARPKDIFWEPSLYFSKQPIYKEILSHLVFVGWNVEMGSGSAFTDGIYPIYLSEGISGKLCFDSSIAINVNRYGLVDNFTDSETICKLNNEYPNNEDFWYSTGIYVDKYTYNRISKN